MKLFDKYGYKFTLWMVARSAEVTGFYPRLLAEKGHEVGPRWVRRAAWRRGLGISDKCPSLLGRRLRLGPRRGLDLWIGPWLRQR